ncbi:alanine--tRNA ligase [Candidatus Woesearchaeota archaeon]|nr:MAG: alanine--tRNA ligase [Candidatus Woesearchaeota archaeon]
MNVKQVKEEFRLKAAKEPEKYFATDILKQEGFQRKQCHCGKYFWSIDSNTCGNPECSGGFRFIHNSPAKNKLDYVGVWKEFSKIFKKLGYTPIDRYPVAARWRDDTDFVQASIYDFQPYVVSGAIEPPANPLVVPQFCLRFNDIDNVGITGAHNTGFVMIGQHAFVQQKQWDQNSYFSHILQWLTHGLKLPKDEIVFHEDGWAGGGNAGVCMEFFSRGVELGNQVYMQYEQTDSGFKELPLRVLDMGMGQERNAWFSQGTETIYDATFPEVITKLMKITGYKKDADLLKKFTPLASLLNVDEAENIEKAWKDIAKEIGLSTEELKKKIIPLSQLYSIAEHSRSLLVTLNDGVLPSNVKGGYNLRVLLRRSLGFIEKNKWDISLPDIAEQHAKVVKALFPELKENIDNVAEILEFEKRKYLETSKRNREIIKKIVQKNIDTKKMLELYDSQGITPDELKNEAEEINVELKIPENFYALVSELHEKSEQKTQTKKEEKLDIRIEPTKILYYDHYDYVQFDAIVLKIIGNKVILDRSAFYPTSGGQMNDEGTINSCKVIDVFKQGAVVIHVLEKVTFKENEKVNGKINIERRTQLAQHHTATHIINGVSKQILGKHVWQAGAAKTLEKGRLDITHYDSLSNEQVKQIEAKANEYVKKNLPVYKTMMARNIAEQKYGFTIYQGGAVPGKQLRIVEVAGLDVEACGGTHLDLTGDVGEIKILKTTKLQDGVVRIEFTAGKATDSIKNLEQNIIGNAKKLLYCSAEEIPGRAKELFEKWKLIVKKGKDTDALLTSTEKFSGDIIEETAKILQTQPEHIIKTLERFDREIKEK